jgi:hypothetical protein
LARYLLGAIRITVGSASLFAPVQFARSLGIDPDANPAAVYILRLFGVRTLVIGAQLVLLEGEALKAVDRPAALIHASDVAAAALAGRSGHLPRDAARKAMLISSVNVALALLSRAGRSRR